MDRPTFSEVIKERNATKVCDGVYITEGVAGYTIITYMGWETAYTTIPVSKKNIEIINQYNAQKQAQQ